MILINDVKATQLLAPQSRQIMPLSFLLPGPLMMEYNLMRGKNAPPDITQCYSCLCVDELARQFTGGWVS